MVVVVEHIINIQLIICDGHTMELEIHGHIIGACAKVSSLTLTPECKTLLSGYQPSLFECQDNKAKLCSLKLCDKHAFIVKC